MSSGFNIQSTVVSFWCWSLAHVQPSRCETKVMRWPTEPRPPYVFLSSFGGTVSPNTESWPMSATLTPRAVSGLGK